MHDACLSEEELDVIHTVKCRFKEVAEYSSHRLADASTKYYRSLSKYAAKRAMRIVGQMKLHALNLFGLESIIEFLKNFKLAQATNEVQGGAAKERKMFRSIFILEYKLQVFPYFHNSKFKQRLALTERTNDQLGSRELRRKNRLYQGNTTQNMKVSVLRLRSSSTLQPPDLKSQKT